MEEEVFGGHEEMEVEEEVEGGTLAVQVDDTAITAYVKEKKGIVWLSKVVELLKQIHGETCTHPNCFRFIIYRCKFVGSGFQISWSCQMAHNPGQWYSQPHFKHMLAGNLLMAAGIVLSGNSFLKILCNNRLKLYFKRNLLSCAKTVCCSSCGHILDTYAG